MLNLTSSLRLLAVLTAGLALSIAAGCATDDDPPAEEGDDRFGGDCDDDDPLTYLEWGGFCGDRVDDNCTFDVEPTASCSIANTNQANPCNTGDEPCPATLPGSAAPTWDCNGDIPSHVIASANFTSGNEQVDSFCAFVYESAEVADEFYLALQFENGTDPRGPDRQCNADFAARRHLFLTTEDASCPGITITHPAPIDEQLLSNPCRKMMRNLFDPQSDFDPEIQFFASSLAEANEKLVFLTTAEIACIGINNTSGTPFRTGQVWAVQAVAPIVLHP